MNKEQCVQTHSMLWHDLQLVMPCYMAFQVAFQLTMVVIGTTSTGEMFGLVFCPSWWLLTYICVSVCCDALVFEWFHPVIWAPAILNFQTPLCMECTSYISMHKPMHFHALMHNYSSMCQDLRVCRSSLFWTCTTTVPDVKISESASHHYFEHLPTAYWHLVKCKAIAVEFWIT